MSFRVLIHLFIVRLDNQESLIISKILDPEVLQVREKAKKDCEDPDHQIDLVKHFKTEKKSEYTHKNSFIAIHDDT